VQLRRKRVTLAVTAGALVVGLGAFGGPEAASSQATPSVCRLVTTQEAARILGTPVNKGKQKKVPPQPGANAAQCEWSSKKKGVGGISGKPFKLQVELTTGSGVASDYEEAKASIGFEDLETVPDLGTEAFYDDSPFGGVHTLVSPEQVLSVKVTNYNTAKAKLPKQPEEMSIDAARLAVPRLSAA
jgi:hypothetical protein